MRTGLIALAAALLLGCTERSPAVVAGIRDNAFHGCAVYFGWTQKELFDHCGQPRALVNRDGSPGEKCALYDTEAVSFGSGGGPSRLVACMQPITVIGEGGEYIVTEIYALGKQN